jgi:hypothetical protein
VEAGESELLRNLTQTTRDQPADVAYDLRSRLLLTIDNPFAGGIRQHSLSH